GVADRAVRPDQRAFDGRATHVQRDDNVVAHGATSLRSATPRGSTGLSRLIRSLRSLISTPPNGSGGAACPGPRRGQPPAPPRTVAPARVPRAVPVHCGRTSRRSPGPGRPGPPVAGRGTTPRGRARRSRSARGGTPWPGTPPPRTPRPRGT